MLPIICIALVAYCVWERYRRSAWTCWGLRQRLIATWAEFQHSMVYYVTDQCRKRLEACINAEGGHSEHLLWHCLSDNPVATHHNRFFSEAPTTTHNCLFSELPTFEKTQQTFSQMKKFAIHNLVWWHFQVGWASGLQFVFFWDNVNNLKYICWKWLFWISQGKVATSDR